VRDASEAGVDLAADRALDVVPGIPIHLEQGDRTENGEGHEDSARHPRDLEILLHTDQHTRNGIPRLILPQRRDALNDRPNFELRGAGKGRLPLMPCSSNRHQGAE
jgi:hypothetical protein